MKMIVETTGEFMLHHFKEPVPFNRPAVVSNYPLIQQWLGADRLRVLAEGLENSATDAEFETTLKENDGDVKVAIGHMVATYGRPVEDDEPDDPVTTANEDENVDPTATANEDENVDPTATANEDENVDPTATANEDENVELADTDTSEPKKRGRKKSS